MKGGETVVFIPHTEANHGATIASGLLISQQNVSQTYRQYYGTNLESDKVVITFLVDPSSASTVYPPYGLFVASLTNATIYSASSGQYYFWSSFNLENTIEYEGVTIYYHTGKWAAAVDVHKELNVSEIGYNQNLAEALPEAYQILITGNRFPITYHYENSTVSGPAEAAVGDTVVISAIPNNNYGITDAASQILVTNNDVSVPYQWNQTTNTITFTMPDPS